MRVFKLFRRDSNDAVDQSAPAERAMTAPRVGYYSLGRRSRNPYQEFAQRWWWLVLLGTLIGIAGALGYNRYGPVPYESTALVQVGAVPGAAGDQSQVNYLAGSYVRQAGSPIILSQVSDALRGRLDLSTTALAQMYQSGQIAINQLSRSNLIAIDATDTRPWAAQLLADTIADKFTADAASRYDAAQTQQRQQLQQQIDQTRKQLFNAELSQNQQNLTTQVHEQQVLLLQIQSNFLQQLQNQLVVNQLNRNNPNGAPANSEATKQADALQAQLDQQATATVTDLQNQLDKVNAQLASAPDEAAAAADQQRLSSLLAQQQDLQSLPPLDQINNDIAKTQARLAAARIVQKENALDKQVHDLQVQIAGATPDQMPALQAQLADAQNQLAAARGQVKASGFTDLEPATIDVTANFLQNQLATMLSRQGEREQGPSAEDLNSQISALQKRLTSEGKTASLLDQKNQLESQLASAQSTLAQRQQGKIQRLLNTPAQLSPQQQQSVQQMGGLESDVQKQWLQGTIDQRNQVQKNIDDLQAQLNQVNAAIAKLPTKQDPALAAAYVAAYSTQLQTLTGQYAQLQTAQSQPSPISRFGVASQPLPVLHLKKLLAYGAGAGFAVALALAYGLDELRRRRLPADRGELVDPESLSARMAPYRLHAQSRLLTDGADQSPTPRSRRRRFVATSSQNGHSARADEDGDDPRAGSE